jgi:hypothetical protein
MDLLEYGGAAGKSGFCLICGIGIMDREIKMGSGGYMIRELND